MNSNDDIDFGLDGIVEDPNAPINTVQQSEPISTPSVVTEGLETEPVVEPVKPPVEERTEPQAFSHEYESGTVISFDGIDYTISETGDLVNEKGEVFKKVDEVKNFVEANQVVDDGVINLDTIVEKIGIDVMGEDGKPINFTDDVEGVSAYIESVIELKESQIRENTIKNLFDEYPALKLAHDYIVVNGSLDGINDVPDVSSWNIEPENIAQQEHIVRMEFEESGKGDASDYIAYLKDSGKLADQANKSLALLQEKRAEYEAAAAKEAEEYNKDKAAKVKEYWTNVDEKVRSRNILGFKIPETFKVTKEGKESVVTPNDFFKYVSVVGKDGFTGYSRDLSAIDNKKRESDELDRELLHAYLQFTGGKYSDLVKHFVKAEEVKRVTLQARKKTSSASRVAVTKKTDSNEDILLD